MYRFLLTPRWLGGLALALAVAAVCVLLGSWQWERRAQARERNAPVAANYDREPVPVPEALATVLADGRLDAAEEWTPVAARGRYQPARTLLVRNRPLQGAPGYHVLVPLDLQDGGTLVVNRGWVPTGATGTGPDAVPPPPAGAVEVVARLRRPEPTPERQAPAGQLHAVDLRLVADVLGVDDVVEGAYAQLGTERPSPPAAPRPLPRPALDEGPHLSYSLQWFVFAAGALVGYAVLARRAAREHLVEPARPARRRRTAEQEEDDLLDAAERRQRQA